MKTTLNTFAFIAVLIGGVFAEEAPTPEKEPRIPEARVHISGEVINPKTVSIPCNVGLVAAIYAAGGPNDFGTMRRVTVLRDGKITVFDRSSPPKEIFLLKDHDVIIVPIKNMMGR
jgi:hypothetical protein